jgi:hypothetical protein
MQSHIGTIRNSRSYGVTSAWEPIDKSVLTRVTMFGKSLPLNNDTSSTSEKVLCH